jgi:hypothetical protein
MPKVPIYADVYPGPTNRAKEKQFVGRHFRAWRLIVAVHVNGGADFAEPDHKFALHGAGYHFNLVGDALQRKTTALAPTQMANLAVVTARAVSLGNNGESTDRQSSERSSTKN